MARQEADREDLLQETMAYPRRGLLTLDEPIGWVLIGERQQGAISIYCGTDPVFQFNRDGYLRRAFWQGTKWAAASGRLEALVRIDDRSETSPPNRDEPVRRVLHQRRNANANELLAIQNDWEHWRHRFCQTIAENPHWARLYWETLAIARSSGLWHTATHHFARILRRMPSRLSIAQSPAACAAIPAGPCWLDEEA